MKTFKFLIFALFAVVIFSRCEKDEQPVYYSVLGIMDISADSVIINADDDTRLLIQNWDNTTEIKNGDRVVAYFTLTDKQLPIGIDNIIGEYSIQKLLFKQIFILTAATADSIGDDPLTIDEVWLSKDYLNINFSYLGGEKSHYINLIHEEGILRTDTIDLEIRHNSNDDNGYTSISAFASFDLKSVRNEVADSVVLRIKANVYDVNGYEQTFIYKY
jgi:hypothetical protein